MTAPATALAEARAPSPMVQFKRELEAMSTELVVSPDIPIEKMKSAIIVAVQKEPRLLNADRGSLWRSARMCAADGLLPDGREAAFVLFDGAVQYLPMIFGVIKRLRNSGQLRFIRAEIVYSNDDFAVWIDEESCERRFRHNFDVFAPKAQRGEPVGAYAVAGLRDGTVEFEPMSAEDIDRIRRVSRTQKGPQPSGVWATWWDEMWKKTVIRRLSKRLPVSADNLVNADFDEEAEGDDAPPAKPAPRRGKAVYAEPEAAPETGPVLEGEIVDAETGEVTMAEPGAAPEPQPETGRKATKLPKEARAVLDKLAGDLADALTPEAVKLTLDMWSLDLAEQIEIYGDAVAAERERLVAEAQARVGGAP